MKLTEYADASFFRGNSTVFAFRRLLYVPRRGEIVVFNDVRYVVSHVEWCLDENASTLGGLKVNIEIK